MAYNVLYGTIRKGFSRQCPAAEADKSESPGKIYSLPVGYMTVIHSSWFENKIYILLRTRTSDWFRRPRLNPFPTLELLPCVLVSDKF